MSKAEFLIVVSSTWAMAIAGAVAALAAIKLASDREKYAFEGAYNREHVQTIAVYGKAGR